MTEEAAAVAYESAGEDGYLTIHGLRIHYLRWGDPGRDPVVLLHGMMHNARYWEHIAAPLAEEYCVYAPDLRGHGESDHAPGGYLVWAFAQDLRAFVEALDLETFDLVSHSIGSRAAIAYARDHSHRIKHLVLADMGPEMAERGARGIRQSVTEAGVRQGFPTEEEALEYFARLYPGRSREFRHRQLAASLTLDERVGQLVFRFDPALRDATGRAAIVEIPYLWESLEHIRCPTLVLRGEKSTILSREVAEEMVRRLPNARLEEIPGSGHQIPLHQPERFLSAVRRFLRT